MYCEPEHPGGVHPIKAEADAVKELFRRYSSGTTTLSQLAGWMDAQGFHTRNMHRLRDIDDGLADGPSLFTTASVRGILHNPFYAGKIKHRDQLLPGNHDALVSQELFNLVQSTMRRNSSRSETLQPRPEREYLLKGLIKCAHCGMSLWAQTLTSGSRLYREQARSRSHIECPGDSKSIRCDIPDEQMGRIVGAIILPDACLALDYILGVFTRIVRDLRVYPERMWDNIESTRGLVFSQRVLLALVDKGLGREEAYKIVQRNAVLGWDGQDFRQLIKSDNEVSAYLSEVELEGIFDYGYYTRYVDDTFQRLGLLPAQVSV